MPLTGGSRHYDAGLGDITAWSCPACGTENQGDYTKGCPHCGAGREQAYRAKERPTAAASAPPPPPPPRPRPPLIHPESPLGAAASQFAEMNPHVGIDEAWLAGYEAGVRATLTAQQERPQEARAASPVGNEGRAARTICAALEYFIDHILIDEPPQVEAGEWCSAEEVRELIAHFTPIGAVHA